MNAVVIENVPVADLSPDWRVKLAKVSRATVTVRIAEEAAAPAPVDE